VFSSFTRKVVGFSLVIRKKFLKRKKNKKIEGEKSDKISLTCKIIE
jgi:hypothetical protein